MFHYVTRGTILKLELTMLINQKIYRYAAYLIIIFPSHYQFLAAT